MIHRAKPNTRNLPQWQEFIVLATELFPKRIALILDETSEFFPGLIALVRVLLLDVRQPIFVGGLFPLNLSSEIT